jgi:hypothetical protein
LIDLLDENDSIMADKGFTIRDVLEKKKCKLNIPPFRGASAKCTVHHRRNPRDSFIENSR